MKLLLDMNLSPLWLAELKGARFVTVDPKKTRVRVLPLRSRE